MRIIVEVNPSPGNFVLRPALFLMNLVQEMALQQPADTFIVITSARLKTNNDLAGNLTYLYINTPSFRWAWNKWWYISGLPRLLHRKKADLFITLDNAHARRYKTPCCHFLVNALSGEIVSRKPLANLWRAVGDRRDPLVAMLRRASLVVTFTEHDRQIIREQYGVTSENCKCLPLYVHNTPLKWPEKESIKTRYSGGLEYFIFAGDIHQRHLLIDLLKAYAEFKKWQKSGMRLIIAGPETAWTRGFREKLASFKYRNDVHLIANPPEEVFKTLIAGAYALLYPSRDGHFPDSILLAMQADVPVIASPLPVIKELAGNGVIYPDTDDVPGFAKSMQAIYKDEQLRADVIVAGRDQMEQHRADHIVRDCLDLFRKSLDNNS